LRSPTTDGAGGPPDTSKLRQRDVEHRHGLDSLLDGRAPVDAVQIVQVDVVHRL